jgi:hypothetical protein
MNTVMGIDPGTMQTAFAVWNGQAVLDFGIVPNAILLNMIRDDRWPSVTAYVEMVASYGMPVGREVFETVLWIGRFIEAFDRHGLPLDRPSRPWQLVYRQAVKLHFCHSVKAKDSNIRMALIDRFGPPGTKRKPGTLYGIKKDIWSALAIAVMALDPPLEPQPAIRST